MLLKIENLYIHGVEVSKVIMKLYRLKIILYKVSDFKIEK